MHDNLKARLASGMNCTVPTFPEYVERYIDRANELYRSVGYGDAPWQVIPLLVLMAELEERFRLSTIPSTGQPALPYYVGEGEPDPTVRKVHWKTRQAQERRAAQLVGA